MIFIVIDNQFNQTNYPELIDKIYSDPPAYAIVKSMPDPHRYYSCWKCNCNWIAKVELESHTISLSGEKSMYCPKCHEKTSMASAWIQSNGNPFPFPKPKP